MVPLTADYIEGFQACQRKGIDSVMPDMAPLREGQSTKEPICDKMNRIQG